MKGPLIVRVGLATDLEAFELACCDRRVLVQAGDAGLLLDAAIRVEPAGESIDKAVYRLQVAALKNEQQAQRVADSLSATTRQPTESVFDADTDLYRVRWGRFSTRDAAVAAKGELERLGVVQSWVVSEGGELGSPALRVTQGEHSHLVPERWLEARAPEGEGIEVLSGRYRGKILIFLNRRGRLNVVNELPLEDYLRGVVPKEMGPELYNELEAIKAQAVAARTFTLRNLGEFADEGYDICSTPRCQVYGGMGVEHRVSDRAIAATVGQVVLYQGEPAETFYSATCGGHTENVEEIFPLKRGAYLRGTPCVEAGVSHLSGALTRGIPFPAGLMRVLLPSTAGKRQRVLAARLEHLALLAGLPVAKDRLRSLERGEVLRFVASLFDLVMDRHLLSSRRELAELLGERPTSWRGGADDLAQAAARDGTDELTLSEADSENLLFQLALHLGVVERHEGRFLRLAEGRLLVRHEAAEDGYLVPGRLATFHRLGTDLVTGPLHLMAGDRVEIYLHRGEVVAIVQLDEAREVILGRRAPRQRWSRFLTDRQVETAVQARYPGFPFKDFNILRRGVSGRVSKLELLGRGGEELLVEGLAVRWTLDLPDTSFQAQRQQPQDRPAGWLFRGRGWGHGVGMCQAGAFGMAMRGHSYRDILEYYYTGIVFGRIKQVPERPRPFSSQQEAVSR